MDVEDAPGTDAKAWKNCDADGRTGAALGSESSDSDLTTEGAESSDRDIEIELLLQAIYRKFHYDFRNYARTSLQRRVAQALMRLECRSISHLQEKVLHDANVLPMLLDYLTVSTTQMFRDPAYFARVRTLVIPYLRTYPSLKVWVAGCSSGEELYSLAIVFAEEGLLERTIFYATDISPSSLRRAYQGIYEREAIAKASSNYVRSGGKHSLADYYSAAYGAVQFDRGLVKNTVFSDHSLATDSVFSEVHLVSCRNVLIYFDRVLQDRAIGLFREALVRQGFLGLGAKESLLFCRHRDAFAPIADEERIFQKR